MLRQYSNGFLTHTGFVTVAFPKYWVCDSLGALAGLAKVLVDVPLFGFDIETNSLREQTGLVLGVGFSFKKGSGVYIPLNVREIGIWTGDLKPYWGESQHTVLSVLGDILTSSGPIKAAHNAGFDLRWLQHHYQIRVRKYYCTQYATNVAQATTDIAMVGKSNLEAQVKKNGFVDLQGHKDIWKGVKADSQGNRDLSLYRTTEEIGVYCARDSDAVFRLAHVLYRQGKGSKLHKLFLRRLNKSVRFVNVMRSRGFLVDTEYLNEKRSELIRERSELLQSLRSQAGRMFNPLSPHDTKRLFWQKMRLPRIEYKGVKDRLPEKVLQQYADRQGVKIAEEIIQYRKVCKLISTYFDRTESLIVPNTGRVHADINLWGARTGRLSCKDPNLQNLPARKGPVVKRMFIASPGYVLVGGDYSQIELRIIAWLSQDEVLMDVFCRGSGDSADIHKRTATEIFRVNFGSVTKYQRDLSKQANFAWCYGGGPGVLIDLVGYRVMGPTASSKIHYSQDDLLRTAKKLHKRYFEVYAGIPKWTEKVVKEARKHGYVESMYGRRLQLPHIRAAEDKVRKHSERQAINMNPQSTASDYLMFRFEDIHRELKRRKIKAYPLVPVHDQLVFEVEQDKADLACRIIEEVGVRQDESGIGTPMQIKPVIGRHLGEL